MYSKNNILPSGLLHQELVYQSQNWCVHLWFNINQHCGQNAIRSFWCSGSMYWKLREDNVFFSAFSLSFGNLIFSNLQVCSMLSFNFSLHLTQRVLQDFRCFWDGTGKKTLFYSWHIAIYEFSAHMSWCDV